MHVLQRPLAGAGPLARPALAPVACGSSRPSHLRRGFLQQPAVQSTGPSSLRQRSTGSLRARGQRLVTRVAEAQDVTIELNNEEDPESTVRAGLAGSKLFRFAVYVRTPDQQARGAVASNVARTTSRAL
jgi:hypothetical protein